MTLSPQTLAHLLTLAANRRAELLLHLRQESKFTGGENSATIASLELEHYINNDAMAQLEAMGNRS